MIKATVIAAGILAGCAVPALAEVVCNQEGDCWRVTERRSYGPELKLRVYPDNWKWADKDSAHFRWREHGRGHGYWRNGIWVEIK